MGSNVIRINIYNAISNALIWFRKYRGDDNPVKNQLMIMLL
jgi:hypothetical protein